MQKATQTLSICSWKKSTHPTYIYIYIYIDPSGIRSLFLMHQLLACPPLTMMPKYPYVELMALHIATTLLHPHLITSTFKNNLVLIYLLRNYKHFATSHIHHPNKILIHGILIQIQLNPAQYIFSNSDHKRASMATTSPIRCKGSPDALDGNTIQIYLPYPHSLHSNTFGKTPSIILTHNFTSPTNNTSFKKSLPTTQPFIYELITPHWSTNSPTLTIPPSPDVHITQSLNHLNVRCMGNCCKHLIWPKKFPSPFCSLCPPPKRLPH